MSFWRGNYSVLSYFCKKKMRSYSVLFDNSALCDAVFRISANAAKERGDALHAATEEDKALIEGFFLAAMPALRTAFGRFIEGAENGESAGFWQVAA